MHDARKTAATRKRRVIGVTALATGALFLTGWGLVVVNDVTGASPAEALTRLMRDAFGWSGLFVLALAAFLVATGLRFLRDPEDAPPTKRARADRRPRADPEPVPVPPEEAELEDGDVVACLRCGSTHVKMPSFSDGVVLGGGELLNWVCSRCHWRGAPMQFEHATAYRAFVKGLHEERDATRASRVEESRA